MEHDIDMIDQLIRTTPYNKLSKEELEIVSAHIGSEQEYTGLRTLLLAASSTRTLEVSSRVRSDLTERMKAKNQHWMVSLWAYKTPAYLNLAVVLALVVLTWLLLPAREVVIQKPIVVELPGKTDTLVVVSPADTIYIDKIIEIKVPVFASFDSKKDPQPSTKGSTLADQKELRELLARSSP
ncbi:MAG: hypothetical protein RIC35_01880 [Marinoscillum sp.]